MSQEINNDDIACAIRVIRRLPALVADRRYRDDISLREADRQSGVSFTTIKRFEETDGRTHVDTLLALLEWMKAEES